VQVKYQEKFEDRLKGLIQLLVKYGLHNKGDWMSGRHSARGGSFSRELNSRGVSLVPSGGMDSIFYGAELEVRQQLRNSGDRLQVPQVNATLSKKPSACSVRSSVGSSPMHGDNNFAEVSDVQEKEVLTERDNKDVIIFDNEPVVGRQLVKRARSRLTGLVPQLEDKQGVPIRKRTSTISVTNRKSSTVS